MNNTIITDSSVIVKWFLEDEQDRIPAIQIQKAFTTKDISIIIPHLAFYEVGNVLKVAVKAKRVDEDRAKIFYKAFLDLEFVVISTVELFNKSFLKALKLNISSYDASYIVLAENLKIPFYTADEKLLQKAKGKYVKHVKHYISPLS